MLAKLGLSGYIETMCKVTAHRLWYVATQGLSVYCLQNETVIIENSFVIEWYHTMETFV